MKRFKLFFSLFALFLASISFATVPQLINFQGRLTDSLGNPVSDGSYSLRFRIYDDSLAGNVLWEETDPVQITKGLFTVLLGSTASIPDSTFYSANRWLGIKIGSNSEITPRQRLGSVGYSFQSGQWTSVDSNLFRLNGNVGIGTAAPTAGVKLTVTTSNFVGIYTTGGSYGIDARGSSVGVLGIGGLYGVHAKSTGTAAVFGDIGGNFGTYGGYFQGDVKVERNLVVVGSVFSSGLAVSGNLTLEAGGDPVLFTSSLSGEQNRYLALINSPSSPSASGLKAGGVLVADDYSYANPGKNDLIVKGDLQVGGNILGSTPWTSFPFAAGFDGVGWAQPPQYRKIGDIVYIRGGVHKADNSAIGCQVVGTLPPGFRPPNGALFFTYPGYYLQIMSGGEVSTSCANGFDSQGLDGIFFSTTP